MYVVEGSSKASRVAAPVESNLSVAVELHLSHNQKNIVEPGLGSERSTEERFGR